MLDKFRALARAVPDPRVAGRSLYSMEQILTIVHMAFCSNAGTWKEIHIWAANNFSRLLELFPDLTACPSEDTIARVVKLVNEEMMSIMSTTLGCETLRRLSPKRKPDRPRKAGTPPRILAIDGKTARGAKAPGEEASKVHIVNAVIEGVTVAMRKVSDKSNEITIVPVVLDDLHRHGQVRGTVVTSDAMSCQKAIVDKIKDFQADYVICLKGNQGIFHDQVVSLFERGMDMYPGRFAESRFDSGWDKLGGRLERRGITVVPVSGLALEWLPRAPEWAGIKSVLRVEREAEVVGGVKKGQVSLDVRYFVSSLLLPPADMLGIVVGHWQVETMHLKLDKTCREDERRVWRGMGPVMLSFFRRLALNLASSISRQSGRTSTAEPLEAFANNFDYLLCALKRRPEEVWSPRELRALKVKEALEAAEKRRLDGGARNKPKTARLKAA